MPSAVIVFVIWQCLLFYFIFLRLKKHPCLLLPSDREKEIFPLATVVASVFFSFLVDDGPRFISCTDGWRHNCGCCPSDDMLPAGITKVKGSTNVCDGGGLDCFAEGASVSISNSGEKIDFQMCIDGNDDDDHWKWEFLMFPRRAKQLSCGHCNNGNIIV